jgi:hypothetical protein
VSKDFGSRLKWAAIRRWMAVAGLFGVGILPCPDCGAPMIVHFWPMAMLMILYNVRRGREGKSTLAPNAADHSSNGVDDANKQT